MPVTQQGGKDRISSYFGPTDTSNPANLVKALSSQESRRKRRYENLNEELMAEDELPSTDLQVIQRQVRRRRISTGSHTTWEECSSIDNDDSYVPDGFHLDHPDLDHPDLDHPDLDHPDLHHPHLDHSDLSLQKNQEDHSRELSVSQHRVTDKMINKGKFRRAALLLAEASDSEGVERHLKPFVARYRIDHTEPITKVSTTSGLSVDTQCAQSSGSSQTQISHSIKFAKFADKSKGWLEDIHLDLLYQRHDIWIAIFENPLSSMDTNQIPSWWWERSLGEKARVQDEGWTATVDTLYLRHDMTALFKAGGTKDMTGYAFVMLHRPEYQKG